jgi:hypothetical protein
VTVDPYPGNSTTAKQLLGLAVAYHEAAKVLLPSGKQGDQLSRAPWRLIAIHAVELYLNALLLHFGQASTEIRNLQHNVAARTELAIAKGLTLRKRTVSHLETLSTNREYLTVRYSPDVPATISQINRLNATLEELAEKVTRLIAA